MTYDLERSVRARRSVRTYDVDRPLLSAERAALREQAAVTDNPFGAAVRFRFLDHAGAERDYDLHCKGVVVGTETYLGGAVETGPMALEGFGYAMERIALFAADRGIGSCWIAGTLERPEFEKAMALRPEEVMPAVLSVGYAADKPTLKERAMRKAIRADSRMAWEELFFDGAPGTPLTRERAGRCARALELLRLGPSAVNKQPWRVVRAGNAFHFLERRTLSKDPTEDVQRVDMGIAMFHFEAACREDGLSGRWSVTPEAADFPLPEKWVYTATWTED